MALTITSTAFSPNGAIPSRFTCEGDDIAPAIAWSGVPEGARSLVLIVDDPDAPDPAAPKRTFVHWLLYDIPPSAAGLAEGMTTGQLPAGTREGVNDVGGVGYTGPCPPIGRHRYFFKLYALDALLGDLGMPKKPDLEAAMREHVLGQAEIIGTYQKKG